MLGMNELKGTLTALATPFSAEDGAIDFASLERLLEVQLSSGVKGLVVCGSTGEAATLSAEEQLLAASRVRQLAPAALPCLAGISVSSTAAAANLACRLADAGMDGILLAPPPYNKPAQRGIVCHFEQVYQACKLPLVAYNIPGRCGVHLQAATVKELSDAGLIIGLKEASGSLDQALDVLGLCRGQIALLAGEDSLVLPLMVCGASGVISASANVAPQQFVELTEAAMRGDWLRAQQISFELLPLVRCMFLETNPVPVKAALELQGVIRSAAVRLPLLEASNQTRERIKSVLIKEG